MFEKVCPKLTYILEDKFKAGKRTAVKDRKLLASC